MDHGSTSHLRRVSIFSLVKADWKLAAENCIRYRGLGHELLSGLKGLEGPFTCGLALQRYPSVHKVFLSGFPGVKGLLQGWGGVGEGGQNPVSAGSLSLLPLRCSGGLGSPIGGLEVPSRKVFYVKVMG